MTSIPQNGLVAHYELDGNVTDSAGTAQNGSATASVDYVTGVNGQAADFDNVADKITIPHSSSFNFGSGNFSISAWVKLDPDSGTTGTIVGKFYETAGWDSRWRLYANSEGKFGFHWSNGSSRDHAISSTETYDDGEFHHVTVVVDRSTASSLPKLFIDGEELTGSEITHGTNGSTSTPMIGSFDNNQPVTIGYDPYYPALDLKGAVDDVLIYNRALTDDEVAGIGNPGELIEGGAYRDYLTGTDGADTIIGNAGHDFITGLEGNDVLVGNSGNDVINGGEGSDTYLVGGSGDGFDKFLDSGTGGTDVILATEDGTRIGLYGTIEGIEAIDANGHTGVYIQGTSSRDVLDFSDVTLTGIDRIDGGGGHDIITGSGAADTFVGNSGNDVLDGGDGADRYEVGGTGDGFDRFLDTGVTGTDIVVATENNTRIGLYGTIEGIETIDADGHTGVYIQGTSSRDTLDFSNVTLTGIDRIDGGAGHDYLTGSDGADTLVGNTGNDVLEGGLGADVFDISSDTGSFGNDKVNDFDATSDQLDLSALGLVTADLDSNGDQIVDANDATASVIPGDSLQLTFSGSGTVTLIGVPSVELDRFIL